MIRSEKRKSEKKEDAGARKGRKVAKHCVFTMFSTDGSDRLLRMWLCVCGAQKEPVGPLFCDKFGRLSMTS